MPDGTERRDRWLLSVALAGLAALYLFWFREETHRAFAYLVFTLPPLLLAALVALGRRTSRFWSGVLALFWFAHGVMIAWAEPAERGYALAETALAVAIVFAASAGGLRARARKRKAARGMQA